jgi:hypothetical protein
LSNIVCLFVHLLSAIVVSANLWFTVSDYRLVSSKFSQVPSINATYCVVQKRNGVKQTPWINKNRNSWNNTLNLSCLNLFLLECMYQARKVNSFFVFICWEYRFCLFLRLFYWIMELFRQFGIFFGTIPTVVFFGTVPTVWYFFWNFRQCGIFWNCSNSVVFLELFRQCGIFLELFRQCGIFGTVPTVVFFSFSILFIFKTKQ